jgi:transposase
MPYQRVEILTGTERRRSYTPAEKARLVDEAFRPGVVVADAARRLGVHESLLYRWRRSIRTASEPVGLPAFTAVAILPEPSAAESPSRSPPTASVPAPSPAAVLEIELPDGTRVRLSGVVDPALAVAVLGAVTPSGRAP